MHLRANAGFSFSRTQRIASASSKVSQTEFCYANNNAKCSDYLTRFRDVYVARIYGEFYSSRYFLFTCAFLAHGILYSKE